LEVTFEDFLIKTKHLNPNLELISDPSKKIESIKLIEKNTNYFEPHVLYLGRFSYLYAYLPENSFVNAFCISDKYIPKKILNRENLNLVMFDKEIDAIHWFNICQDFLNKSKESTIRLESVFQAVCEKKGLQGIVDNSYFLFNNPVIIFNLENNSIHCSNVPKEISSFPVESSFNLLKNQSYIDTSIADKINGLSIGTDRLINFRSEDPIIYEKSDRFERHIGFNIIIEGKIAAHVVVVELNTVLTEIDLSISSSLSNIIKLEYTRHSNNEYNKGILSEYFLYELIDGPEENHKLLIQKALSSGLKLNHLKYAIVVDLNKSFHPKNKLSGIISHLKSLIKNTTFIIKENYLIGLSTYNKDSPLSDSSLNDLNYFFQSNQLLAAISQQFYHIEDFKKYVKQAMTTLELAETEFTLYGLYQYKHYFIKHVSDLCKRENDLITFIHPSVFILKKYDSKHNTSFLLTLFVYIKYNFNTPFVSNKLHIHRNTLDYRLKKIVTLTNIQWDQTEEMFQIYLSINLLDLNFNDY